MAEGTLTKKELFEQEAIDAPLELAKNIKAVIDANEELKRSAKESFELMKKFSVTTDKTEFVRLNNKQIEVSNKAAKAYEDQGKALAKVDEERQKSMTSLLRTTNKLQNVNTETNKQNIQAKETLKQQNREIRLNLTFMGQLINKRDKARKSVQEFQAQLALGKKLSDQEQRELKQSTKEFQKYDKAVKGIRKSTNQFQENVGNYPKFLRPAIASFKTLIPLIGAGFGLR